MPWQVKDEAGKKYGRLQVVKRDPKAKKGSPAKWLCLCDCGGQTSVRGSCLRNGEIRSCGCLVGDTLRAQRTLGVGESSRREAIGRIRRSAAQRGLSCVLTDEQLTDLMLGNCFYCGLSPSNQADPARRSGSFKYSGIDRVDNARGYQPGNVVSCCAQCNRAKRDLSLVEFLEWMSRFKTCSTAA